MPIDPMILALLKQSTTPLVPQIGQAGDAAEQSLSMPDPNGEDPKLAALKGFGAGALKGASHVASDMTSPLALIAMLLGGGGGMSKLATMAGKAAPEVGAGLESAASTVSHLPPEFTALGDEGAYNATRNGVQKVIDPVEAAYQALLKRGGR